MPEFILPAEADHCPYCNGVLRSPPDCCDKMKDDDLADALANAELDERATAMMDEVMGKGATNTFAATIQANAELGLMSVEALSLLARLKAWERGMGGFANIVWRNVEAFLAKHGLGEPGVKGCEHDKTEDCMFCEECGACSETLDYDDICQECREKEQRDRAQQGDGNAGTNDRHGAALVPLPPVPAGPHPEGGEG
jgi:hypothetical protein